MLAELLTCVLCAAGVLVVLYFNGFFKPGTAVDDEPPKRKKSNPKRPKKQAKRKKKPNKAVMVRNPADLKPKIVIGEHPLLITVFRGHMGEITGLSWSKTGKYIISSAKDGQLRAWHTDIQKHIKGSPAQRVWKISTDDICSLRCDDGYFATLERLPNNHIVTSSSKSHSIHFLHVHKITDDSNVGKNRVKMSFEKVSSYPTSHSEDISDIFMHSQAAYLISGTSGNKTDVYLTHPKQRRQLAKIAVDQFRNYSVAVSNDGRHITVGTVMRHVKIWEVIYVKRQTPPVFEAVVKKTRIETGHSKDVSCVRWSDDCRYLYTGSRDGSWKMWDIDVNYVREEKPKLIWTREMPDKEEMLKWTFCEDRNLVAVLIGSAMDIIFISLKSGEKVGAIHNLLCTKEENRHVCVMKFSQCGNFFAVGSTDQDVRIYNISTFSA